MHAAPPPLRTPYETFLPHMLAELGRLAGEGVTVAPHDGLDFVHGFFLDEWPQTYATYRATEGDPWPYVRTAFRRYVRHESRREARYKSIDAPPMGPLASEGDSLERYDLERVTEAVQGLRPLWRDVLWSYLATASERATARRHGLSRARTRTVLEEAITHVALAVEDFPSVDPEGPEALAPSRASPSPDRREGRLAAQTSADLLRALRAALPAPTPHAPIPVRTDTAMNAADLLRPYLSGAPSPEQRRALRENAHTVLESLEHGDALSIAVLEGGGTPEGYEVMYADLAVALQPLGEAEGFDLSASESDLSQEARIGRLFLALVEAHPQNGMSLQMTIGELPEVDAEKLSRVYNSTPAVAAAGDKGAYLATRGLTPMDFFQAADGVGDLVERLEEEGEEYVCLSDDGTLENTDEPETLFVDEVAHVTGLEPDVARLVLTWLVGTAAGGAPGVFTGVMAERRQPCSAVLRFDPELLGSSLEERWDAVGERT